MDQKTLYKLFDGTANDAEKKQIQAWADADPENTKKFFKEREFFNAILLSENGQYIPAKKDSNKSFKLNPVIREILKIAVILFIAIFCGNYVYTIKMQEQANAVNTIIVPAGQRANLILPDGTEVWLNARTEIKYPSIFNGSQRKIKLNGEAYFEVAHDQKHPFVVETAQCDVEVLGTKFNVDAYEDSGKFSTALMEGSVKITDSNDPSKTLLLRPNYEATYLNQTLSANRIEDYEQFRWREGFISFRNTNFMELMRRFEKCYGIRIIVENARLSDHEFSGKFRISDGIDNALRVLQRDAHYTFTRNKDESVICIK